MNSIHAQKQKKCFKYYFTISKCPLEPNLNEAYKQDFKFSSIKNHQQIFQGTYEHTQCS